MSLHPIILTTAFISIVALSIGCGGGDDASAEQGTTTQENDGTSTRVAIAESDSSDARELLTQATATIEPLNDSGLSGTVTFAPSDFGVQVTYMLSGLSEGQYGIHIHENGSCANGADGTPGGAAGGHFNPDSSQHGAPNLSAGQRHIGDLGNVFAVSDRPLLGSISNPLASLNGPDSIVGKSVVIHAEQDDFITQPTGAAGARIGCGVITAQD